MVAMPTPFIGVVFSSSTGPVPCSVLHWDGHESAGRSSLESHAQQGSLPDYQFIWSLFRFLQLLCEEHYEGGCVPLTTPQARCMVD